MFENIPVEMRAFTQFVCWRYEDTDSGYPTKVPYSAITSKHASVNDPHTWCTYEQAVNSQSTGWWQGIGFVLTENDPYVFIDLDQPKNPDRSPLEPKEFDIAHNRQRAVYEEFNSYTEYSPSGTGLHIIVKGSVPSGRKRSSMEIYSSARFMTMTGNVYRQELINERNELANSLWAEMGKGRDAELFYAGLESAICSEDDILKIASTAANGEKFHDLFYLGNWQKYNYPSQSEADFALIDIIAYYSKNRLQTQNIFLKSKLAEREKSRAQYRINYMLNRCFDRLLPPMDFEGLRNQVNEAIEENNKRLALEEKVARIIETGAIAIKEDKAYLNLDLPVELPDDRASIYSVPSGLVGQIAQYIYSQAPLPVPEIALVAAIGLMSGIVGKSYNISNTGLNQYTLLLSPTGSGKEAMASGISKLMREVKKKVPASNEFIGPAEISSPQALTKHLGDNPCFVSIVGEFGLALKQMSAFNASPAQLGLRRMLLDVFNKSGEGDQLQSIIYSDKDKNTKVINAPAFSIIGESTPERFYEVLSEDMISEGLLPRFNIIENLSPPAEFNEGSALAFPSEDLIRQLSTLCRISLGLTHSRQVVHIRYTDDGKKTLTQFRKFAYEHVKAATSDSRKQLWNRAHIKALKLAATVAIGNNFFEPTIDEETAKWAIRIISHGIASLQKKFESGEVGSHSEENQQLSVVISKIRQFIVSPWSNVAKIVGVESFEQLHKQKIIPYSFIQHACASMGVFKNDKMGSTFAMKRCLRTLIDRGDIEEMSRADLAKIHKTKTICYMIAVPKVFHL